ncbi:uncharacterized protein TNCV_4482361 [Trichonephila clavipes]|nr:uncharacterized protein TNCV_4482361 [Trichonephila clavipes]
MEFSKKFVLVPEERVQVTEHLSELDQRMKNILHNKDLTEEEKTILYLQVLQKYTHFSNENRRESEPVPNEASLSENQETESLKENLKESVVKTEKEVFEKKFSKMNDIGINIYSFEEDLKIFPLLISDIVYLFENFRKICMQTYKLDPCWYFTTPALSWDAMLLHTKVAIELFTDYDMLLFIEKGVRGGISQCCNRYAIANNRYMSNFNPDDEIKYLMYLDANNLYGYAMSKYLPLKDFVWSDNDLTEQDILNLSDESDVGYILEVDLEYPSDLHDKHSDFPLAPENKPPPNCKEPRLLTTLEPKKQNMFSIILI